MTAVAFAEWMSSPQAQVDKMAISIFKGRRDEIMKAIDINFFDSLAVQVLPPETATQVLNCLPGAGSLLTRIEHAIRKAKIVKGRNGASCDVQTH